LEYRKKQEPNNHVPIADVHLQICLYNYGATKENHRKSERPKASTDILPKE